MQIVPYQYRPYPRWLYHATKPAMLVPDHAGHLEAGPGWFNSPDEAATGVALAEAPALPVAPPPEVAVPVAAVMSIDPPAMTSSVEDPSAEARIAAEKAELYATPVAKIITKLRKSKKETLERVANYEAGNPDGPRASLIKALAAAMGERQQTTA